MANNVFANGREISCKKADGKSICAFPDVCFTPPQTPATPPGVPIPYPNSGMATDTSGGSKKVKISNKEVMLKNKSYFKKSMGDEAGCAPKKGVVTSKNRGKVFFNMWSMDVKVEKQNVVRHLDLTTHNHQSIPGNTPTWPYLDTAAFASDTDDCSATAKKVKEKCVDRNIVDPNLKTVKRRNRTDASGAVLKTDGGKIKKEAAFCADDECKEAMKCVLSPETPNNCCDGKTPHHLLPVHCFMPPGHRKKKSSERKLYDGCNNYNPKKAPCICLEGESKVLEHGEFHEVFDDLEDDHMVDGKAGTWTYSEARTAAELTVEDQTNCDPGCAAAQVDSYHQQGGNGPDIHDDTGLRADSSGSHTAENFRPTKRSRYSSGSTLS